MSMRLYLLLAIFVYGSFLFDLSYSWLYQRPTTWNECKVSQWSDWSKCSGGCSGGKSTRNRKVVSSGNKYVDMRCSQPPLGETKNCPAFPCPIDCVWMPWSSWTDCDPCRGGRKSRMRKVAQPAMFGGLACKGSEFSISSCLTFRACHAMLHGCPSVGMFECGSKDECIKEHFVCNGDVDCRDRSDEYKCEETKDVCLGISYDTLPNGYIMGAGYDIMRDSVSGQVLDNKRYEGACETIYIPEVFKEFRKPYNLQMYRSYVETHTTLNSYVYEDTISLSKSMESEFEYSVDAQPSIFSSLSLGSNAARSSDRLWKKIVDSNARDDYSYVKIQSKIQLGHFKTRRGDIKVSHYFLQRVKKLPRNYDPAVYSHFLSDFGTHYFTEGKLGGVYSVFYQFKSHDLESTDTRNNKIGNCLAMEAFNKMVSDVNTTFVPTACAQEDDTALDVDTFIHKATDSIATVHGGYSFAAAELAYVGKNALKQIYKRWADTVPHNPKIFDFKIAPISELIEDFEIRQNIDKALQDVYTKFDPRRCTHGNCENGGQFVVTNKGRECKCICKSPYYGESCERKSLRFVHKNN
ncbi:complement component C6-like [Styela clava]